MSQPTQDPFDPADATEATPASMPPVPPPVPPIPTPVRVYAQPYGGGPMSVLPYPMPATNMRPGLVTTMGILSIVVAAISMMVSGFTALMWLGFFAAFTSSPFAGASAANATGPKGYDPSDRRVITQALNLKQRLNSAQREQLQFFLADVGQTYVPSVPIASATNDPVADWATANVRGSNQGVEGGTDFTLPMGTLTVTDSSTAITLTDGTTITRSTIRQAPNPADLSQLSPQEVGAVVNRVQEMTYGTPMTTGQTLSLTQLIQANSGAIVGSPKDVPAMLGQVQSVSTANGHVTVVFNAAIVTITQAGQAGFAPIGAGPMGGGPVRGNPTAGRAAMVLMIESLASVGLAIYLLVIAILTLRNSPRGGLMHRVYAWLKLLASLVAAAAVGWLTVATGSAEHWAWIWGVVMLLVGIAYPIVLLFLLPAKSVREWYTPEHAK